MRLSKTVEKKRFFFYFPLKALIIRMNWFTIFDCYVIEIKSNRISCETF